MYFINRNLDLLRFRSETREEFQAKLEARAKALVRELWQEIKIVAAALLKRKTLSCAEVRRLMNRARRIPRTGRRKPK